MLILETIVEHENMRTIKLEAGYFLVPVFAQSVGYLLTADRKSEDSWDEIVYHVTMPIYG